MKVRTSISLSKDVLAALEQLAPDENRSSVIERALREFISQHANRARNNRDLEILNRNAGRLNREAKDVLTYQAKTCNA